MQIESETIIEIANTLGIAVERIFEIFVEAQPVLAMIAAVLTMLVIITTLYTIRYIFNKTKDWDGDERLAVRFAGSVIVFMVVAGMGDMANHILICFLLPEYAAINELIGLLV